MDTDNGMHTTKTFAYAAEIPLHRAKQYERRAKRLGLPFRKLVVAANKESNATGWTLEAVVTQRLRIAEEGFAVVRKYALA